MTDEQRWTVLVCVECDALVDLCGCEPDWDGNEPRVREVVVVPVSSVVPIARLRDEIDRRRAIAMRFGFDAAYETALDDIDAFLDGVECASNPNNERTT